MPGPVKPSPASSAVSLSLRDSGLLDEREAEVRQKRTALRVGLGGGHDGDVEAADAIDLVLVDLLEDRLLRHTEGVVAVTVELLRRQTAEVADAGKSERDQSVQELPRAVTTEGDVRADGLAFAQLELSDRLLRLGDDGLLTGDGGEVC